MWDCIVTPWDVNGTDSFIRVICYCVFGTGNISCWPSVVWPSVSEYLRTSAVIVDVINQRVKSSRPCGPSGNITWCHHTHGSYVLSRLSSFFSMSAKCNYYQSRWFELKIVNFKDALELWHHCHNTSVAYTWLKCLNSHLRTLLWNLGFFLLFEETYSSNITCNILS